MRPRRGYVTLRDVRRFVSRSPHDSVFVEDMFIRVLPHTTARALPVGFWLRCELEAHFGQVRPAYSAGQPREYPQAEVLRVLDRLIARYGPDGPAWDGERYGPPRPRGEARPKDTNEAADVSASPGDGALHGGDGNAGECDAPAETTAPNGAREGGTPTPPGAPGQGQTSASEGDEPGEDAGVSSVGSAGKDASRPPGDAEEAGREAGKDAASPASRELSLGDQARLPRGVATRAVDVVPPAADTPEREAPEGAGADGLDDVADESAADTSAGGGALTPAHQNPRLAWGGWHVSPDGVREAMRRADPRDVDEVVRALDRLFDRWLGSHGEPTPRYDGARLVREIASRRYALARARREEHEPPAVLLLVDVSGSCSAAADETCAAAMLVSARRPETMVVWHSNGMPHRFGRGVAPDGMPPGDAIDVCRRVYDAYSRYVDDGWKREEGILLGWYRQLLSDHELVGVVAWGDTDALWLYRELGRIAPLIWLDSYTASSVGVVRPYRDTEGVPQCRRWVGVNSARGTAIALRAALKGEC